MSPFSVTVQNVPDRELGPLLTRLADAGFDSPTIRIVGADGTTAGAAAPGRSRPTDLPQDWRLVRERDGESYRWPKRHDRYAPYRVFMGTTRAEGAVQIGLGETIRTGAWGRDRKYVVAFLSGGSPQEPLVEFVAADDYEQTRELVAVIRKVADGKDPLRDEVIGRPDLIERLMEGFREVYRTADEAPVNPLTPRELEVLRHVAEGMRNRQISELLDISEQTVKNHLSTVMHKLGAPNRVRAVTAAVREGWLVLEEQEAESGAPTRR